MALMPWPMEEKMEPCRVELSGTCDVILSWFALTIVVYWIV